MQQRPAEETIRIPAREKVAARLQPDEAVVPAHELVEGNLVAVARLEDELQILEFTLKLLGCLRGDGSAGGHRFSLF